MLLKSKRTGDKKLELTGNFQAEELNIAPWDFIGNRLSLTPRSPQSSVARQVPPEPALPALETQCPALRLPESSLSTGGAPQDLGILAQTRGQKDKLGQILMSSCRVMT